MRNMARAMTANEMSEVAAFYARRGEPAGVRWSRSVATGCQSPRGGVEDRWVSFTMNWPLTRTRSCIPTVPCSLRVLNL